jgi:hypothetical protein
MIDYLIRIAMMMRRRTMMELSTAMINISRDPT